MKKQYLFLIFFISIFTLNIYLGYLVIWKKQNEWMPVTYLALIVLIVVVTLNNRK